MATELNIQKIIAEDFWSEPECAVQLEVDQRTLQRWEREGHAPPVTMIRKRRFFERRAVLMWQKQRQKRARKAGSASERVPRSAASRGKRTTLARD